MRFIEWAFSLPTSRCQWRPLVGSFCRFSLRDYFNSPSRKRAFLFELFPTPGNLLIMQGFHPARELCKPFEELSVPFVVFIISLVLTLVNSFLNFFLKFFFRVNRLTQHDIILTCLRGLPLWGCSLLQLLL